MWSFGVGLFLVRIAGNSLQLPATYGLTSGLSIFCLGALVGDWVDSTPRLKAAQLSLVLQNLQVVICAGVIYIFLHFQTAMEATEGIWLVPLCHAAVICTAVVADLASMARVIAVERDWIVKICDNDTDMLAKMTAALRRIDQATLILAPVATGQVMTYAGLENGALFIGAWNLASVAVEYYLMWKVYATVPALAYKQLNSEEEVETEGTGKEETTSPRGPDDTEVFLPRDEEDTQILLEQNGHLHSNHKKDQRDTRCFSCYHCCFLRVFGQITTVYEGWKSFMTYSVSLAGLALSCLFMTVLGFDNITIAYAVTQNLSEAVCGILMAVSAVFGMVGTFVYPVLRQRVGLIRTGMLALSYQVTCLSMCVASIWMPGSPFDPGYSKAASDGDDGVLLNVTATVGFSLQNLTSAPGSNHTSALQPGTDGNSESKSYESVGFLMTGIILSRFGLYMADLSIIQLFLEAIVEKERGIVNGVQNSLNKFMEVLKFLLVVFVPDTQTFGFLIIVSFSFILTAWVLYAIFYRRENGRFVQCPQGGSTARYGQLDSSLEE